VYSAVHNLCPIRIATHHGDKQIGDTRTAHFAEQFQLAAVSTIEQQHAPSENRTFVYRFKGARGTNVLWIHHYLEIPRLELFHAALEDNAATIDKH
jgi:hypothetical protein